MKKLLCATALSVLLMHTVRGNKDLSFIEGSLDGFMQQMVDPEHQPGFKKQYKKLKHKYEKNQDQNQAKWERKYKKEVEELQRLGQSSLDVRRPIWAEQIRMVLEKRCNPVQEKKIKSFLFRCGVYEDFLQREGERHHTLWAKTKAYMRNAGNSVVSWFGSWRKPKTIA